MYSRGYGLAMTVWLLVAFIALLVALAIIAPGLFVNADWQWVGRQLDWQLLANFGL